MDGAPLAPPAGTIGPNAVIQLGRVLTDRLGRTAALDVYRSAGVAALLDDPPDAMTDQAIPATLFAALWRCCPEAAPEIAAEAGRRTADYVIAHRIPRAARALLRVSPRWLGARLLLTAIRKNAWTFAGSGRCTVTPGHPAVIEIRDNPLPMPDCAWHAAVFARLFDRLVASGVRVEHSRSRHDGTEVCRFTLAWQRP